jgi:hypothetical protein
MVTGLLGEVLGMGTGERQAGGQCGSQYERRRCMLSPDRVVINSMQAAMVNFRTIL